MATKEADALTNAYMQQVASIRRRVLAYATAMWNGAESLRDADVDRLVARIAPAVRGGQMQVANLTNAYITRLAVAEGFAARAPRVTDDVLDYRGVAAAEVYRRPAVTAYTALAEGKTFDVARAAGLARLGSIVATDLQQTRNRQAAAAYTGSGFEYTIRVLSGRENCALCVIASTQRYHPAVLQPIHPGCDCGQRGVRAGSDPGQTIDPDLLEVAYAQIDTKLGDRDAAPELGTKRDSRDRPISDYTDLIITREHGELGPTLTWRQDRFTGPRDIT